MVVLVTVESMALGADYQQQILTDVVAYVEVWSSNKTENYSKTFARQLSELGAKISKCFSKDVTHVVFKDGHQSTWNKAKRSGVKLVSVLWVEKCREAAAHIDEGSFPAINANDGLSQPIIKKHKCMQPKDFIEKTPENDRRLQKRLDKMVKELDVQKAAAEPDVPVLLFDEGGLLMYSPKSKITDACSAMEKRIQEMKSKRENLSPTASQMVAETCAFNLDSTIATYKPLLESTPSDSEESSGMLNSSYDDIWENLKYRKEKNVNLKYKQETENLSACTVTTKDSDLLDSSDGALNLTPRKLVRQRSKKQLHLQGIGVGEAVVSGMRQYRSVLKNDQCELSSISIANQQNKVVHSESHPDDRADTEQPTEYKSNDNNKFESKSGGVIEQPSISLTSVVLLNGQNGKCKLQNNSKKKSLSSSLDSRTPVLISKTSEGNISPVLATLNKPPQDLSERETELPDYEDYFSPTNLKESKTKLSQCSFGAKFNKSPSLPLLGLDKKQLSQNKRKKSPEANVKQCNRSNKKSRNDKSDTTAGSVNRMPKTTINSNSELISSDTLNSQNNETLGTSSYSFGLEMDKKSCILNATECEIFSRNTSKIHSLQTRSLPEFESTCGNIVPVSETVSVENVPAKALNGLQDRAKLNMVEAQEHKLVLTDNREEEKGKVLKKFSKNVQNTISSSSIHGLCEAFKKQKRKCNEESKKKEKYKKPTSTLVMTSMSSEKQNAVIQVVNNFGGFLFSDHVCETTTHIVAGSPRRTLNVMLGIARGCWIVSYDWVLWSLDRGHWIPEEPYELSDHFPAAPMAAKDKQ